MENLENTRVSVGQATVLGAGKTYGWEYGDTMRLLKDAGFDSTDAEGGVDGEKSVWLAKARAEKEKAEKNGLGLACYHSVLMRKDGSVSKNVEIQSPHMERAAETGVKYFLVHTLWENYKCFDLSSKTAWNKQKDFDLRNLTAIAEKSKEFGMRTVIENNPWFPMSYYLEIMKNLPKELCGAILDTGHANLQPEGFKMPIEEAILSLKGRIEHLHLHDNDEKADQHLPVLSGQGTLDWPVVFKALKAAEYKGVLNEELPPMTGIAWAAWSIFKRGAEPLRELWKKS